ncbi:hypothetical protein MY804_07935 [Haemophilus influenzae]|uniref:hypothetical protein n=1 Tax=Haemophilus influenzae TaxID=727 RepID=UPI0013A6A2A1|nr:hypothetical protein [Haemophilus influenzae]MCK8884921.1 hypothetical protein [Haemophilus influenzae]
MTACLIKISLCLNPICRISRQFCLTQGYGNIVQALSERHPRFHGDAFSLQSGNSFFFVGTG